MSDEIKISAVPEPNVEQAWAFAQQMKNGWVYHDWHRVGGGPAFDGACPMCIVLAVIGEQS